MTLTAIILAGGESSRMGQDKGLMLLDGKPMIQHIIEAVESIVDDIIIIAHHNGYESFGYPVYQDLIKNKGPLGGIYTGLHYSSSKKNIVLSCDVPLLTKKLIQLLIKESEGFDVTVPINNGEIHPLIAVYSSSCIAVFKKELEKGHLKVKEALEKVNLNVVDTNQVDRQIFTNINSKDDFTP